MEKKDTKKLLMVIKYICYAYIIFYIVVLDLVYHLKSNIFYFILLILSTVSILFIGIWEYRQGSK
jgi:uncharacterized membrane protein YidH (DUF202 family)